MHLRFCYTTAQLNCRENRHAQQFMKDTGIVYQYATPQSLGNQWWFWNCENVPEELPEFLTELKVDPMNCVGHGLSKEDAKKIQNYKQLHSD